MIGRIHLKRSMKSVVKPTSLEKITVMIVTEFGNVPIEGLIQKCALHLVLIRIDQVDPNQYLINESVELRENCAVVQFTFPALVGDYDLKISAADTFDCEVIPMIVGPIMVRDHSDTYVSHIILKIRREFYTSTNQILSIEEEYGSTVGSHIWDCAVVLFRFLDSIQTSGSVALELGAGCGLVGISMAISKSFRKVYVTDKEYQMPYLSNNILLNDIVDDTVYPRPLEWDDRKSISDFKDDIIKKGEILDMIVAADVLYNAEIVHIFFDMLRQLATPTITVIYLAQKMRNGFNGGNGEAGCGFGCFDVLSIQGFISEIVLIRCGVIVWKLRMMSNTHFPSK